MVDSSSPTWTQLIRSGPVVCYEEVRMRTGRPTTALVVTGEEHEAPERWARGPAPEDGPSAGAASAHRARLCDQGRQGARADGHPSLHLGSRRLREPRKDRVAWLAPFRTIRANRRERSRRERERARHRAGDRNAQRASIEPP